MNFFRLLLANLLHYRRTHVAVALGVAAATAVLTGAILVGDSVRGSLRVLALDRLGRIDELLVADRFFREKLVSDLRESADFQQTWSQAEPAFLFPSGTLDTRKHGDKRRASGVLIIGCQPSFWELSDPAVRPAKSPAEDEIVLNQSLADELGLQVGDLVAVRMNKLAQVPADSPLGRKTDHVQSLPNLKVTAILPTKSLASFSLQPQQGTARVAFVALPSLQQVFEQPGKVNAILVSGKSANGPPSVAESAKLQTSLQPTIADLGLQLKRVRRTFGEEEPPQVVFDYFSLSSDRMMLEPEVADAVAKAWQKYLPEQALTYLANSIEKVGKVDKEEAAVRKEIPYSTVTAVQNVPALFAAGESLPRSLKPGEIAIVQWAADDLQATIGNTIRVTYFEPESTHGEEKEATAEFKLVAIVPLTEPTQPYRRRNPAVFADLPTAANDPDFTPEVPGITDQESINSWDPPFPYDQKRVRPKDDDYWKSHRTTPKAYVSVADGERMWGSRFGKVTSFRVPMAAGVTEESLATDLSSYIRDQRLTLGLEFRPVKRTALAAAAGTTPFDVLFLALSMFIIAAALLLVWLLFRLGVEQRAAELGLLRALGWSAGKSLRLQLAEGTAIAAVGAAAGVGGGIAYAWLMLAGLRSWWIGAVTSPFLTLHIGPLSLILGFVLGLLMAVGTIWFSVRGLRNISLRQLLAGRSAESAVHSQSTSRWQWLPWGSIAVAVLLLAVAMGLQGEAKGGAALSSGGAFLAGLLLLVRQRLANTSASGSLVRTLSQLSASNARRNPTRSLATMSLMATAAFLIVAVSAFRLAPSAEGIGGFEHFAESSEPIVHDLNREIGQKALLGDDADKVRASEIYGFRVQPGDDASCRNLYRPSQPRVLGVTEDFIDHFNLKPAAKRQQPAFRFAVSAAQTADERSNPWQLLANSTAEGDSKTVPVILDKNTAMYSLRLYRGIGEEFTVNYQHGQTVTFRVVGLLAESLLQGSLLIREDDFRRLFPRRSGFQFFLLNLRSEQPQRLVSLLEDRLGDEGFDVSASQTRLTELFAVQNTYISTFQSLGGLGLLLGTFGLAAVQMRNILERRGELALLRAVGFSPWRLLTLVLGENLVLLAGGLGSGVLAAVLAVLPQFVSGTAQLPWRDLTITLAVVAVVGLLVSWFAARAVQRAPVVSALRGD